MSREDWTDEKLFFRLLNNKSGKTYWDNIRILRKRATREVFNRCVELTGSENPEARHIGIHILAQFGPITRPFYTETKNHFFERLATEKNPQILAALLFAIGYNNKQLSKSQVDTLCNFHDRNNSSSIKSGLVFSLLGIKAPKAIDILIELSSDKAGHVRDWATFGLGELIEKNNKKIREALWRRVNDRHQDTRYGAILGLAIRKDTRVKEIIKRELVQGENGTGLFEAIIAYGDKEFLPILKVQFKEARTDNEIDPYWLECLKDCIAALGKTI